MDIQVTNLDGTYTLCEELNTLASVKGGKIITDLGTTINNLKNNWIGTDANNHISNLITVHNVLVKIVTEAKKITYSAGNAMIAIQEIRRANGGEGNVGAPLSNSEPSSLTLTAPEPTTDYDVKPGAKNDLESLKTLCTNFETFAKDFQTQKESLMKNWTAGAGWENAVRTFDDFLMYTANYKKKLEDARDNLDIAIQNVSSLS